MLVEILGNKYLRMVFLERLTASRYRVSSGGDGTVLELDRAKWLQALNILKKSLSYKV